MIGILLINLGTPNSPNTGDVRRYLREFLSDPRVIDIPPVPRWLLVNLIIGPFRAPRSAKAYQKIWTELGSPLLFHTQDLGKAVAEQLGNGFMVQIAMRYGKPSLRGALERFQKEGVKEIRALPLYPQYASSSTGSTEEALIKLQRQIPNLPEIRFLPPFFDHPGFLKSFATIARPHLENFHAAHVLFSFHGLPVRQILKADVGGNFCLKANDCCEQLVPANGMCYRAHCFQSARGIARELELPKEKYTISFQSRLGRTPWIEPFTDFVLRDLAQSGTKRVAVFCPSFVSDCLETLEEIGIRAREKFREDGGEDLLLIPSLNSHPMWVQTVSQMLRGGSPSTGEQSPPRP